jgi:hypothetical protein
MEAIKKNSEIVVTLSSDESLVLFEWLSNFNQKETNSEIKDEAEQRVLFDLEAVLESTIIETFKGNYLDTIKDARARLRDEK